MSPRMAILFSLLLMTIPLWSQAPDTSGIKPAFFKGKVAPIPSADDKTLALVGDDGKTYPLYADKAAETFVLDKKLQNRPMRLTARLLPDGKLQVVNIHSYLKGRLHDVYYWCDICTIKGYHAGICDCCGDPMEFRETPAKE